MITALTFDCRDPPDVRAAALSSLGWPVRAGRSAPSGGALVTHIVDCLEFIWAEDIVDHGGEASALLLRSGRAPQPHLADASSDDWADDWAEALSLEAEAFDVERGEGRLGLDA